jgi:hypothetical protein
VRFGFSKWFMVKLDERYLGVAWWGGEKERSSSRTQGPGLVGDFHGEQDLACWDCRGMVESVQQEKFRFSSNFFCSDKEAGFSIINFFLILISTEKAFSLKM